MKASAGERQAVADMAKICEDWTARRGRGGRVPPRIYTKGFTLEQVYYQLKPSTDAVMGGAKKFLAEVRDVVLREASDSADSQDSPDRSSCSSASSASSDAGAGADVREEGGEKEEKEEKDGEEGVEEGEEEEDGSTEEEISSEVKTFLEEDMQLSSEDDPAGTLRSLDKRV